MNKNMLRIFRDAYYSDCGGVYVVHTENKEGKTIIECECGTHLLQATMDADIYTNSDDTKQVHQSYYFAMFSYGNDKRDFWSRLKIAYNYLRTGKMVKINR